MKVLNANINSIVLDYFKNNLKHFSCIQDANKLIKESFGIISFFHNEEDLSQLKKIFLSKRAICLNLIEPNMVTFRPI